MNEFKGTKGKWEARLEGQITSSVYCGDKQICLRAQDNNEAKSDILLISKAPEMLEMLINYINDLKNIVPQSEARDNRIYQVEKLIKEATEI